MKVKLLKVSAVALSCIVLGACSTTEVNDTQAQQARSQLQTNGVSYSSSNFINCASNGDLDSVKLFLAAGMDVNTYYSSTALSAASAHNKIEVVNFLIQHGANPNIDTFYGTALILAVKNNNPDVVKILLAAGADPNAKASDGHSALSTAAFVGNPVIINDLVAAGAKVDFLHPVTAQTPLSTAAYYGKKDAVVALINANANINYVDPRGMSILDWSQIASYNDITKILVDNGASLQNETNGGVTRAMVAALAHEDIEMIQFFASKGVDVNGYVFSKMPILVWCSKTGLQQSAIELIKLGANPKAVDPVSGCTALDFAISYGQADLAKTIDPSISTARLAANTNSDPNIRSMDKVVQDYVDDQYYQGTSGSMMDNKPAVDYQDILNKKVNYATQPAAPTKLAPLYTGSSSNQSGVAPSPSTTSTPAVSNLSNVLDNELASDTSLMQDFRNDPVFKNDDSMNSDTKTTSVSGLSSSSDLNDPSYSSFDSQINQDMNSINSSVNSSGVPSADQK